MCLLRARGGSGALVLRWCLSALLCVWLAACESTGSGTVITDTGKTRAMRERAERDARLKAEQAARQQSTAAPQATEPSSAPADAAAAPNAPSTTEASAPAPEAAAPESAAAELPATTVLPDAGGAPAVLVDVVRPAGADSYDPVADSELAFVQIVRGDAGIAPQRGVALTVGDEIITGADTVAVLNYPPNIEIYVMPNTHVRIGSIFVKIGEIWVSIKGALKEKFKVETEFVTAGVEGTEFLFRAGSDGAIDVDVLKGAVLCTSKTGRWAPIRMQQREKFFARRNVTPIKRSLASADIARVQARVRPVNVAVATKLAKARVIPLEQQIHTARPVVKTPLPAKEVKPADQPEIKRVPQGAVKPQPTMPETKTLPGSVITQPSSSGVVTKPSGAPSAPAIKTLPSTAPATSAPPKSTTTPIRTLPKTNQDVIKTQPQVR